MTISKIIIRQIGSHRITVMSVVKSIFLFSRGFVGAEGGVPSATFPRSFWVVMFSGRIINKVKNQMTANKTKAADIVILCPLYFLELY